MYLPLGEISQRLGGTASWDTVNRQVNLLVRGETHIPQGLTKEGRFMVNLYELTRLFGVYAVHDTENRLIAIDCSIPLSSFCIAAKLPQLPRPESRICPYDLHWLARIVHAEARGECYESRLAVANVVLNRVEYHAYPNTVREVIFDRRHGVQFTPTANGAINNTPDYISYKAARNALLGKNNASSTLFFMNPRIATNFWIPNNREYAFTIGGHAYFY